ncbi:MAG: polyamine aminopropyltransferase [Deltaproteobacteria bacterium]|nr:polyamine aminopropyltransferase [Deltaproteobacteria bacterium]
MMDSRLQEKKNVAYEEHDPSYGAVYIYEEKLASIRSKHQKIEVLQTKNHGRILLIDDFMMLTEDSEFVYHEMIVHVPLASHPLAKRALVIGGGDGGVVRELLKYRRLEKIVLVEIDEEVIRVCQQFFPEMSRSLSDPKVEVIIGDGVEYVKNAQEGLDIIIIDSTDPFGVAEPLISPEFYQACCTVLGEEGLLMQQVASPFFTPDTFVKVFHNMRQALPIASPVLLPAPFYVSSDWSLGLASASDRFFKKEIPSGYWSPIPGLKYYNPEVHRASFALPNFVRDLWDRSLRSPDLPKKPKIDSSSI